MAQITVLAGLTLSTVKAGITQGTTDTNLLNATTTAGFINGKWVTAIGNATTVAPIIDINTGVTCVPVTKNKGCVFVIGQNAAATGTVFRVCQGPLVDTHIGITTTPGAFIASPQFPGLPDDFMPVAYFVARAAPNTNPWTFGVTNWTGTGMTYSTVQNVAILPNRPQIA